MTDKAKPMIQEVIYSSVEKGLNGQQGYCVVARTRELSPRVADHLAPLSNYQHLRPGSPSPTNYGHSLLESPEGTFHLLSRVGDGGRDYSGRRCLFAHHISLPVSENLPAGGAAWTCAHRETFYKSWDLRPGILKPRLLPETQFQLKGCHLWKKRIGSDRGAHQLADAFRNDSLHPVYVLYEPAVRLLPLLVEATCLLPAELRWQVTFCTFFAGTVPGLKCQWRGVPQNSTIHRRLQSRGQPMIDLTSSS